MDNLPTTNRPKYCAPGSVEWLREIEGPKLVQRLLDEVHASPVGEMTPTQARCASMILDRALPTLTAVHHTVEGNLARMSEADIIKELQRLTGNVVDVQARQIQDNPSGSIEDAKEPARHAA